ncbi:GNAT family N-acetyltransferase [Gaetbulibacter sp. M235]|uniref:GNAT family N-acetyltransferase n=1 Tax=Gaetbulibacter sp. M235 TaxID=3126510 RepID=UPI00374E6547
MIIIRNAKPEEFESIGKLMVNVYSQLEGFPKESEFPEYYKKLLHVGDFTKKEHTELIVAISNEKKVVGAVVYFSDLKHYGSPGTITTIKNASAFRLLAVDPEEGGKGIGKLLIYECINRAKKHHHKQLLIHSTEYMKLARSMYERLGFSNLNIDIQEQL